MLRKFLYFIALVIFGAIVVYAPTSTSSTAV